MLRGLSPIAPTAVLLIGLVGTSCTGVTPRNSQFYLPGNYNYAFYDTHTRAARSFYAAHVAHFGIYEVALTQGEDATDAFAELAARIRRLVTVPPKFEPPAELIAPSWMRMAHATGRAMDWTHHLHSQLYDILTDPSVTDKQTAGEGSSTESSTGSWIQCSCRPPTTCLWWPRWRLVSPKCFPRQPTSSTTSTSDSAACSGSGR